MGILRSDRVSGLGGANAINGSVRFGNDGSSTNTRGTSLNISGSDKSDLNFAGNDFTWEAWVYPDNNVAWNAVYCQSWGFQIYIDTTHANGAYVKIYVGSNDSGSYAISGATSAYASVTADQWNHIAFSRNGNSWTIFTNGTAATSSTNSQSLIPSNADYTIGIFNSIGATTDSNSYYGFKGYISNLRIRTGAHYTASFTPPTERLTKTSDTVLLCCQSPGDVTKEETGKTLTPTTKNTNDKPPAASHFAPDKGEDYGTTFEDNTKFDTLSYMVPPGGTTIERSRGRAVFAGGYSGGPSPAGAQTATMTYAQIQSDGNAIDFGDLTAARWIPASGASSTRGTFGGGANPTRLNTIDYVTIATTSNATEFGDLTTLRTYHAGFSNSTRAISGGGNDGSSNINTIDYITIASAGNATDFGDMLESKSEIVGDCSPTRGLFMGGTTPTKTATVDYITIATTGNEQAFGDLSAGTAGGCALSSNTRAIYAGGARGPVDYSNVIGYFTIATLGNETDFGDLITARSSIYAGTSNNIRGVIVAGFTPSPTWNLNSIEHITIATTGNANDFGDITVATRGVTATSDSHGGLS